MKKFLALLLTLLMVLSLGTVALADIVSDTGDKICEIDLMAGGESYNGHLQPGESYVMVGENGLSDGHTVLDDLEAGAVGMKNSEVPAIDFESLVDKNSWRISASWDVGGAMVKGVRWDKDASRAAFRIDASSLDLNDNGAWVLDLNENYTISTAKVLKGTVTFTSKQDKSVTHKYTLDEIVSNRLITVNGYKKQADAEDDVIDADNNTLYQCDKDNPGYICFNDGRLLSCTLKMVKSEKAFMYNDEDLLDAVEEKYGNAGARIDCYNFGGTPTFQNDAQFKLQADYADQYCIYTWDGTKLNPVRYEWDSINGVYRWNTKPPGTYVISDKELVAGAETAKSADKAAKNPDTGASDIVGIAAVLAVVSLAAGAAVSHRK